jgi:ATP-dependent Clp protease ATP-binding subunit ClpB
MIRIDMSEYQERHTVSRLIGAPPGYVGYEEGGQLTEAVRRRPYSVVLFDEVEKAHPEVFNLLLQLLDDGRLTDSHGKTVDFRNAVIIMTSNIGSVHIQEMISESEKRPAAYWVSGSGDSFKEKVMEDLKGFFRPEFLNRVDEIIIFNPLTKELLGRIVEIQVERMKKFIKEKNIDLRLTESAKEYFAEIGFDPIYGARPLKRVLQKMILNELARKILEGAFQEDDTIEVDISGEKISFSKLADNEM